jgi:hypothetical protein
MQPRCSSAFKLVALVVCACGDTTTPPTTCDPNASSVVMIAATPDYRASTIGSLPLDGSSPAFLAPSTGLGGDPALASSQGRRFFIARDEDTFFEADACGKSLMQYSARATPTEGKVDPQDVAVAPDGALWVARLDVSSLLVIGVDHSTSTIDLSSFDADTIPDASSIRILGHRAFVTLERLTTTNGNQESIQPSQMVAIDTDTHAVVSTITLAGRNPLGLMKETNGILWLADAGSPYVATETDAGVEMFDTASMTSSLLLSESDLGGSVAEVAVTSDGSCGAAILFAAQAPNAMSLVSFSIDAQNKTASKPTTLLQADGFDLRGLFWTLRGTLLVGDDRPNGANYPVHVFQNASCALTETSPLNVPGYAALAFSN